MSGDNWITNGKTTWDTEPERKKGRKPIAEKDKRKGRFMVYLTDEEHARFTEAAKNKHMKAAPFARQLLLNAIQKD